MRDDLDIPFPGHAATMAEPFGRAGYGTRQSGLDPNTRRMAIIAGGIGAVLLVVVGIWSAMAPRRAGTPLIEADARPVRERPVNKGGLSIVGADESAIGAESEGKAIVAPSPEAPALAALKAASPAMAAPAVTEMPKTEPAKPAPVAAAPSAAPSGKTASLAPPSAPAPAATAAHPALPTTPPAAGGAMVQLAAVGSEQAAQSEWQRLSKKFPDLLGSRHLSVSHVDRDGKTFWRVRTGGFADAASATAFCGQIKAKGAACSVASF